MTPEAKQEDELSTDLSFTLVLRRRHSVLHEILREEIQAIVLEQLLENLVADLDVSEFSIGGLHRVDSVQLVNEVVCIVLIIYAHVSDALDTHLS